VTTDPAPTLDERTLTVEGTDVEGGHHELRALVATPAGSGPWPGVVMIHEVWGIDDVLRRQAERLARAGYVVVAPDLDTSRNRVVCIVSAIRAFQAGTGRPFADLDAARRYLAALPDCTGRVGVIGFCLGGGFALACATTGDYAVAAANYGRTPTDWQASVARSCPVVGSYPGRDRGTAGVAARLERTLSAAGVDHDIEEYPKAGHSFLNDEPNGPRVLQPLLRVNGVGPQPESARDAWRRIEAFFARYFPDG